MLTTEDLDFTYGHALDWARPDVDRDLAVAYAVWYMATYARRAETMQDLPAHPHVWPEFLAARRAGETS